jgi:hypothetical protein
VSNHSHYYKDVTHLKAIDVYRVLDLFDVQDAAIAHAVKKLLCAGNRGVKDKETDIKQAIDSLYRQLEMMQEDLLKDGKQSAS